MTKRQPGRQLCLAVFARHRQEGGAHRADAFGVGRIGALDELALPPADLHAGAGQFAGRHRQVLQKGNDPFRPGHVLAGPRRDPLGNGQILDRIGRGRALAQRDGADAA
jgi:hypothetical protein